MVISVLRHFRSFNFESNWWRVF